MDRVIGARAYACAGALAALSLSALPAAASSVPYSESFNNAGFQGSLVLGALSTVDSGSSDLWQYTNYYSVNSYDGWTFSNGAYYAVQANSTGGNVSPFNGGVLLNEGGALGAAATNAPLAQMDISTSLTTVVGQKYTVSTNYFGDNRPGSSYTLDLYLNGTDVYSQAGSDGAAGSLAAPYTLTYTFTATSTSTVIGFGQSQSQNGASPIIDNLTVSAVPLPASAWLLGSGVLGLLGLGRRRKAA